MRVLLVSLNAKYVHTNLALRYLREEVRGEFPETKLLEFTINQSVTQIAAEIFEAKADVIGFSCYIWNLEETLAVIRWLHPVCQEQRFVLGGPEVSFETTKLMQDNPEVDVVVRGEGEQTFLELLRVWKNGSNLRGIAGITWREEGALVVNTDRMLPKDLKYLPDAYTVDEAFAGRLVYVETSRGCPFSCQYCMSSTVPGVRFLPPERFRQIFRRLIKAGAKTIKFVDRTFNAQKKHAFQILDIVKEETEKLPEPWMIRIHCEMAGELLDREWITYLKEYPAGLLQLEIGVQSTYQPTLEIIRRSQNFSRWKGYIRELRTETHIPIHLDLIAGLPNEGWTQFRRSFNEVYEVQPNMLQLGFLKVLKGSGLRLHSREYGLIYAPDPPYTILQTSELHYGELVRLERIEELLNQYYNSGKFAYSLGYILASGVFTSSFDFYHELVQYWQGKQWFGPPVQGKVLLQRLWDFSKEVFTSRGGLELNALREIMRFDYYLWERPGSVPDFLQVEVKDFEPEKAGRELRTRIYQDPVWLERIPEMSGMDRRQWTRSCTVETFSFDILSNPHQVPGDSGDDLKDMIPDNIQDFHRVWYLFLYIGVTKVYRLEVF